MIHDENHYGNRHSSAGGRSPDGMQWNPGELRLCPPCPGFRFTTSGLRHWMKHTLSFILIVSSFIPCAQAAELGRLFFTPEQRAQLEYKRAHNEAVEAEESDNPTSSVLTVNGIVQKRGGARTVWINGRAQNAGNSDERSPESLAVAVPGKTQPVKVKVGQQLLLEQPAPPKPAARKPVQQKTVKTGNEDD